MHKKYWRFNLILALVWVATSKVQADPKADQIVGKVQLNYQRILSLSGNFQMFAIVKGQKLPLYQGSYSYQTGRIMKWNSPQHLSNADGVFEYHADGSKKTKNPVVSDDLFYLPYNNFITLAPTLVGGMETSIVGEDSVQGKKVLLLEGKVKGNRSPKNRLVWKITEDLGMVLEVDEYDGTGNLAIKMEASYTQTKGVEIPDKIIVTNQGKVLQSQEECDFDPPTIETSSSPKSVLVNATITPVATQASGGFVSNVFAGPNVSKNGEPVVINFTLGEAAQVTLSIFTLMGEQVFSQSLQGTQGPNQLVWALQNNAKATVASGLYVYVLSITDGKKSDRKIGKIVILR